MKDYEKKSYTEQKATRLTAACSIHEKQAVEAIAKLNGAPNLSAWVRHCVMVGTFNSVKANSVGDV